MDMLTLSITILIFLSVYTAVYSLYLYRQMHVSLVLPESADISVKPKARFIENTLHKLLKPFGFLAKFQPRPFFPRPFYPGQTDKGRLADKYCRVYPF